MNLKEYPILLYPNNSRSNIKLINKENYRVGYSETFFESKLKKYFGNYLLKNYIIDDGRNFPYYPDFILHIPNKNLIIDIEIDEPYAFISKDPIHINDDVRNFYFQNNGWGIIRFAEIQTVQYPELCCKIISEYIQNFTRENIWIEGFHKLDNLDFINAWNISEAQKMANNSFRNTYLNLIPKINENPPEISIIADGIFLNNEIKNIKELLIKEESILNFNNFVNISVFCKHLSKYFHHSRISNLTNGKIYIEFSIFISQHHSFYNFSFDTDFFEIGDYIINIYFVKTDNFIFSEIFNKIKVQNTSQLILIADDPAYPKLLKDIDEEKLILVRNYHNTHMPDNFNYISIHDIVENSLNIKYK